jgi:sialidase-1
MCALGRTMITRRIFFAKSMAVGGVISYAPQAKSKESPGDLFEPIILDGISETAIIPLKDGRPLLAYTGRGSSAYGRLSKDTGRTWGEPFLLKTKTGDGVPSTASTSLIRLQSGKLGLFCSQKRLGWKNVPLGFFTSPDEGDTWSDLTIVNPPGTRAHLAMNRGLVLEKRHPGRIIAETFYRELGPMPSTNPQHSPRGPDVDENLTNSVVYFSDDEGKTWQRALQEVFVVMDYGKKGFFVFEEPVAVELKNGDLLMFGRTNLGQLFTSRSGDSGYSWEQPIPAGLASSYAPCIVKRIPTTGDLLLIWQQASREEIEGGYARHRLSCAISKDEAKTWQNFRNLESLDDTTHIEPPKPDSVITGPHYNQPKDLKRYHRAPGSLRCSYPRLTFFEDKAIVSYDYGSNMDPVGRVKTKIRVIPVRWFY